MTFHFHSEADDEVQEALKWYRERSLAAMDALDDQIAHAVNQITARPLSWPPYRHRTRHYILHGFPYHLVYRVLDDGDIVVFAFAHLRRRPTYWRTRL